MSKISDKSSIHNEKPAFIRNSFPIQQVKKMIGKKLIIPMPNMPINIQDKNSAKLLKTKILEEKNTSSPSAAHIGKKKNLIITAMYNNGVLHVFKHIDIYLAINSISYKELAAGVGDSITVIIHQYPKLLKSDLKKIL